MNHTVTIPSTQYLNIYSIANQHCDREIVFKPNTKYAVVCPSCYGKNIYTTHKTERAAIRQAKKLNKLNYHYSIIDRKGNHGFWIGYYDYKSTDVPVIED